MPGKRTDVVLAVACALAVVGLCLPRAPGERNAPSFPSDAAPLRTDSSSQATLEGRVILPSSQHGGRRFRGRAYRQRTNSAARKRTDTTPSSRDQRHENVIVSAHPSSHAPSVEPLPEPVTIDQEEESFVPHVTPVTAGTTVEFVNSDPFYHNVFSLTPGARFNIGRRPTGVVVEEVIPRVEGVVPGLGVINLHCDIHPQMNAFIVSLETPHFTRVEGDGTYELENLPEGSYTIRAYAPRENVVSFPVELEEGDRVSRSIDMR